jgi:hypothetical protein
MVVQAQSQNEITVGKISPGEIDMAAFKLTSSATVMVAGSAATFGDWDDEMAFYGWIIDSKSRKVVWHLRDERDYRRDEGVFEFETEVDLDAGEYEVYFAGTVRNYIQITGWGDFWNNVFGKNTYKASYRKKLFMTVTGPSNNFTISNPGKLVDNLVKEAIVSIIRVGDHEDIERSFNLTASTDVKIYSIGEGTNGSVYDFAWIYDETNHERIWTMDSKKAEHAGGGKKNIVVDEEITLPAGSYTIRYTSDDSHSFDEWNVLPPNDPQFWGITIWTVNSEDMSKVKPYTEAEKVKPIIEMIRVGNDEFHSQGFKLSKDLDVRVFCLGEGSGGIMADYGWIIDADTKKTTWKMTKRRTENGGGADKNRLFDETISLQKGNYIAYYTTDDSHSYEEWNATRPIESERWGLTIWTKNNEDGKYVQLFDENEYKNENVLAEIIRVRDHKEINKKFELNNDTKVRIIAVGEGDKSEMYDYGWIENDKGKIVWEMTFRKTEHAGGSKKNRLFNDTIVLEKGAYYVYYETDGSHSYNEWNSTPPDNPELYGITILFEN